MKNFFLISVFFMSFSFITAQRMHKPHKFMREKYRQLEKLKLLEVLQLDEETAIRFFSRRDKFYKEQKNILDKRKSLIEKAEVILENKSGDYDSVINGIKNIEEELLKKRSDFIDSVKNILTKEQIVKMIIFDFRFKEEIRGILMKKERRKLFK